MKNKLLNLLIFALIFINVFLLFWLVLNGYEFNFALFNPKGLIASEQSKIIINSVLIMLVPVVPVLIMAVVFARKYRAGKTRAKYAPDWDYDGNLSTLRWLLPSTIVVILAIMTWKSTQALDPFKSINSTNPSIEIQVVALEWKWLFIYPQQNIATVNYFVVPEKTPIKFELTADAPMNSFWIPQLGGQMYAMAGMKTNLNLIADEVGEFEGFAAEINGEGFSEMTFTAKSVDRDGFDSWVLATKNTSKNLSLDEYDKIRKPSVADAEASYAFVAENLFEDIVMKYTGGNSTHTSH